jgi:tRNA(Met) cytidine acetyltransferase
MLTDALSALDPDVVRGALAASDASLDPDLSPWEWRLAAGQARGTAILGTDPRPARRLVLAHLLSDAASESLTDREERLLVRKVLQAHPWDRVADELDYHATAGCMRAVGDAVGHLVGRFGDERALAELERLE